MKKEDKVKQLKVERQAFGWFKVSGGSEEHLVRVFYSGLKEEVSCDCHYWALHGIKGKECSHILAVKNSLLLDKIERLF